MREEISDIITKYKSLHFHNILPENTMEFTELETMKIIYL